MALPRSMYVLEGQEGVYHCYTRCVRRAFLCGFDPLTQGNFSHRKQWIVNRLRFLSSIFAIDVIAYAILETHHHNILRTRPDLVDKSGRIVRPGKPGAVDPDLGPILLRIGATPDAWQETVTRFGSKFRLAAGLLSSLRRFADQLGRHWFTGVAASRTAFAASRPLWA